MISELAVVETDNLGENLTVAEFAIIRTDVVIGNNVIIHPHVIINSGVIIGDGVEIFPGVLIGKEPKGAGATARLPKFNKHILIGANCSIGPHAVIFYDVEIGENTLVGDGASIREQCRIGSYCIISRYVTINYNTTIGNNTKIMDLTHITGNCEVGSNVFISILVGTVNDTTMGEPDNIEDMQGPIIENGAKIGVGATLLTGVVIGKEAIVGAGSVVTKNVGPKSLVMGIPARHIRRIGDANA